MTDRSVISGEIMPKEAFANLSHEKRERILDAATQLFARSGFDRTDVGRIAAAAGIAKGSLYNYFESKEDLFGFVCRQALERHRRAVYGDIDPGWDVFSQVDHIFRRGVAFVHDNPDYIRLYLSAATAEMERFADRFTLEVEKHTADHLKKVIRRDIRRGIVRGDVDVNLAAWLINNLYVMFVVSLVSRHFQIRMKEYLGLKGELKQRTVQGRLDAVIDLICRFLRPTTGAGPGAGPSTTA